MSWSLLIYLASVSGNLGAGLTAFWVIGGIALLIVNIMFAIVDGDNGRVVKFRGPGWAIGIAIALFLSVFVPSERTFYMMVGAGMVQEMAQSPEASRISERVIRLIETKLDATIEDLQEEATPTQEEQPEDESNAS